MRFARKFFLPALTIALTLLVAASQPLLSIAQDAAIPAVPSRVVSRVSDASLVTLKGNTHPLARPEFDKGLVDPGKLLERIVLVLQRSPEQEQALAAFNQRQYDPSSPDYHHWLHAQQFGELYGPNDADITAVTSWLQNHGFQIGAISKGRVTIEFTGTVAQVQDAFHVEMHKYLVNGEAHIANDRDPQIPSALAPVITGIASLHDFFPKPQSVFGRYVKRDRRTGKITPVTITPVAPKVPLIAPDGKVVTGTSAKQGVAPQFTYTDEYGDIHEDVTPFDFAAIYNLTPLWNAGSIGSGVPVAISGVSDIKLADLSTYRSTFGLPATTLNVIHNGTDPGINGGAGENTLDVEMVSAAAPGAQIDLVVSASTSTSGGDQLSNSYIIDNEIAPIMSASYGTCELGLGTAGNAAYNKVWQQGATEGISIFESSGDQGSAGCSDSDAGGPNADQIGLQVNGIASSPYLTAVGGTDFTWSFTSGSLTKYFNSTNDANGATFKGILPEVPWNSTCTNPLLVSLFGASSEEQLCNGLIDYDGGNFQGLIQITGGSGGVSHCTTSNGSTPSSCSGGYAKPSWQVGSGVPADGKRDLPDVSLFASDGFPDNINGSAILVCESSNSPTGTCDYSNPDYIIYQEVGGTSASSPFMAGIMSIILQKTGTAQGLANPELYKLAQGQQTKGTACNSSTVTNGNSCIFYDVTQGTNSQVCFSGGPNCDTTTSGDELGVLSGYNSTTGYDLATGLGTLNVANLVNAWPTGSSAAPVVTLSATSLTFPSTAVKSTAPTQSVTLKNSGTATLDLTGFTLTGSGSSSYGASTTCGSTVAAGGSCSFTFTFQPQTTGTLTASFGIQDNAANSPQSISLTGTGAAATPTVTVSPTSLTFASTTVGSTTAAQLVTIKNTGTTAVTPSSETVTGTNASSFMKSATTCGSSLAAAASCTVSVEFKPAAAGALAASLSIADNATGSPQTVALKGTGVAATHTVTVSPTSLTFASTTVGSTTTAQLVTIKNTGNSAVTLSSETVTGTNASSFLKSATTCGSSLAAAASCTVSVEFKPAAAGALAASLSIADNATGSPQTVALKGTGVAATPAVKLSATALTFAATAVGSTTAAQTITLTNSGTGTLDITSIVLGGTNATSFLISAKTCGTTLAAGKTCTFSVEFKPEAAGALTADVALTDNAAGSPQKVTLSGTGETPAVKLSATSLTFATTKVGTATAAQVLTLTNSGTATLDITSIALGGTNATSFLISAKTCGTTLAAGKACTVSIEFKPAATGSLTGDIAITDNATGSPQKVTLSGKGD